MLEMRQVSDHELETLIGGAQLRAMDSLYIDDVLAIVDRGLEKLPSYLDLYRKAIKQAWTPDELDFSRDRAEWEFLSPETDRKSTRLNSSHVSISYAVFCLKKK